MATHVASASDGFATPSDDERRRLLDYLAAAHVVMAAAGTELDEVDHSRGAVVPIGWATDGAIVWSLGDAYYTTEHARPLPSTILESARRHDFTMPDLSSYELQVARASLRRAGGSTEDVGSAQPNDVDPFA